LAWSSTDDRHPPPALIRRSFERPVSGTGGGPFAVSVRHEIRPSSCGVSEQCWR
jgi:hypothetical protein